MTHLQFPKLLVHPLHFHQFSTFRNLCSAPASAPPEQKIPSYSFLEPRFLTEWLFKLYPPEDYHPPHNVCLSEQYVLEVYNAVRQSPYRDKILLVVTFDEHGGCYDHVAPPTKATAPMPGPVSRDGKFHFDRFGVRVPTIVISSYVQAGTVFRAPAVPTPPATVAAPYDHTSILATLRDWKQMASNPKVPFLPSPRITIAPTLNQVLTLPATNKNPWPSITSTCKVGLVSDQEILNEPLNDLQLSILIGVANMRNGGQHVGEPMAELMQRKLKTQQDAIDFMGPERLLAELT